ncbi:MAG: hypothetical protein U0931_08645 [Vulcanimicrobiota bacterium]
MAILLAIFFMILLSMIAIALIGMVPVELQTANRTKLDLQAHYAATAGIRRARAWATAVMAPETNPSSPDNLGDVAAWWGNTYCNYLNEVMGCPNSNGDFKVTPFNGISNSDIPTTGTNWGTGSTSINKALNIPSTASTPGYVPPNTLCLVSKNPINVLSDTNTDWQVRTIIIPDADSPGGVNTLDGSGNVYRQFGGAGNNGQRCYQIICIAYYQGYPVVRAKSVFLESSFARYSLFVDTDPENSWYLTATAGQQSTEGPVHTNHFFRFALNSNLWSYSGSNIPFKGLMTFATRPGSAAAPGLDYDGALYYKGNDANGTDSNFRPFGVADENTRYAKMIDGGRGNLRQTASPINLPQNTSDIMAAAYGDNRSAAQYTTDPAITSHLDNKGIYVFGQSTDPTKVAGGVVIKGDQSRMFLEAIGSNGLPYGVVASESTSLAAQTATATVIGGTTSTVTPSVNPGIRVQASSAITKQLYATSTFPTSTSTARNRSVVTTVPTSVLVSTSRSLTSTSLSYALSTQTFGTTSTWTVSGGGAAGVVQTTSSFVPTSYNTLTTSTQTLSYFSTAYRTDPSVSTSYSPWTTSYSPPFDTSTSSVTASASWKPIDQVIETKNVPMVLSPSAFSLNQSRFTSPAGNTGSGANMQTYTIVNNGTTTNGLNGYTQFLVKDGAAAVATIAGSSSYSIPTDKVVVIKQSRQDPQTAVVEVFSRGGGSAAAGDPVLNGAVFTEGNVLGLAGVNVQRKTIGGQIQQTGTTNPADPLAPQPANPSSTLNIRNNIWQIGTNPKATIANDTNKPGGADHGLGLVAESINVNALPSHFSTYSGGDLTSNNQILTIYATMLAGRKATDASGNSYAAGGFTVGVNSPITSVSNINYGNMGNSNITPLIRTVGGLIVANYYGRINLINQAGWNSAATYDQQLANKPPPYFPKGGGLVPLTYVEERVWGSLSF